MSIFKVKHWWSNNKEQGEESKLGLQNAKCLKVDRFACHSDSDCIIVAEGSLLKLYRPSEEQDVSNTLLEMDLSDAVLQVETGKFVLNQKDLQILILHPKSYAIYELRRNAGHTEAGDQNSLTAIIKHSFTRRADSLTCGPFGGIKTRDFICIQGLDGSISFFDQDSFLFMCIFNDIVVPAPICYISNCDSFIICKSTWVMEIYSFQQLREFSELTVRQNKKNIPQWIYNAGEEITHIQVIQTSTNFSSILAMGERHLYCFQDNGLIKFVIKFEFMPTCFCTYLVGWFYEPTARLLVMVASDDSKLYVYEGTTLLWSCDLLSPAISVSRCFLKALPGGIVTLAADGGINIGYLGTEPDLNGNVTPMVNEAADPEQIQAELEEVEESLHKILENDTGIWSSSIDQILKIKADIGKPIQNLFHEDRENDMSIHLLMCPIIVILTCEDPKQLQDVQITYISSPPFECSESKICLDNVNGTEIIETQIFLTSEFDISDTRVKILFTITDSTGKIVIISKEVLLPISLYCSPVDVVSGHKLKICVEGNQPCIEFYKIFTDFTNEDLMKHQADNSLTFEYRSSKKTVTIQHTSSEYFIEANEIPEMTSLLDYILIKLVDHYKRTGVKDFKLRLKYDRDFVKLVIVRFLKSIETHAKERIKLKAFEDEMNILHKQFTVIQKKLLVQYGSLPPGDCDPLEFLMKDTHRRLIECVQHINSCRENVYRASTALTSIGRFIMCLLKQITTDEFKLQLIQEMLTLNSLYEHYQDWEEAVAQALTYISNNVFKKSEKDKEKLATVSEQAILSQVNLKRFMKQLRIVIDRMFTDAPTQETKNVTRIEELVEVI